MGAPSPSASGVTAVRLKASGNIPNNVGLPLLLYKGAWEPVSPDEIERCFRAHRWFGCWRDGIYPYHHYHSTAHEVLGCYSGWAEVCFGGERGHIAVLEAGDAVVIPAGVGHCRIERSDDFAVVGAYPDGQSPDLLTGESGERPDAEHRIAQVPLPTQDPVDGGAGRLAQHWADQGPR